ncbi:MAG: GAF domain-containing protein [Anaerolineales bacterium]|nr:GAF domain-containing protein [Anaerolineales bacterium]
MSEKTSTSFWQRFQNLGSGSLPELRERMLSNLSWFFVVAGLGLLAVSAPEDISKGTYGILIFDGITFGILLLLTIFRDRIPYIYRALGLISVAFAQGVSTFQGSGIVGDSRVWFMFVNVFATILIGFRAGLIANGLSLIAHIAAAYLTVNQYIIPKETATILYNTNADSWSSLIPNFTLISLVITLTIAIIIRGMEQSRDSLEETYSETQNLTNQLSKEQELLKRQTTALEKRTRYIEAAADVGKAATSVYNIDEMLDLVVNMISERFGFYQAGIFLIDDRGEYAVMEAASSDGGKRMLARSHKLRVGEEGMVGYVTSQGKVRIALDVGEEATHFSTPELPLTRSEMTLPLIWGGRIFGALDVQSTEENAFSEEDISSLTVLADQVSMAINNAKLFEELQTSLAAERQAFGEISRQAWHNLIRRSGSWGYRFSNNRTTATETAWPDEMVKALEAKQVINTFAENGSLSVPIMISDAPVGVIRVQKPTTGVDWTDDEKELIQTLTDRLSQALESARVYQASQMQAMQEQLTTEISGQLRRTLDIDTVLKTAAKELGNAFKAKEVVIRMAPDESRN